MTDRMIPGSIYLGSDQTSSVSGRLTPTSSKFTC